MKGKRDSICFPDALIEIDGYGFIRAAGPAWPDCHVEETHPGAILLPGFADAHIHFPQTRVLGSASGPLLSWLEKSVFPEEARFAERAYAEEVAREFRSRMIAQGTTCAAIFSSSHPGATDALFAELERSGLRAIVGLTLMDRGAPPAVMLSARAARRLRRAAGAMARTGRRSLELLGGPALALSCTPELLRAAGEFARRHELLVQTHLSENREEIQATLRAFPSAKDYLDVYESFALVGERTLLAHCIWLSENEWERVATLDAAVAHCPDSNFSRQRLHAVAPGVAARLPRGPGNRHGRRPDVFPAAGRRARLRRGADRGAPVAPEELLWRATTGGAAALGLQRASGGSRPVGRRI